MTTASMPTSAAARPRPEVFSQRIVEELINRSPHLPKMRIWLERLEAQGSIVVVDEEQLPRGVA